MYEAIAQLVSEADIAYNVRCMLLSIMVDVMWFDGQLYCDVVMGCDVSCDVMRIGLWCDVQKRLLPNNLLFFHKEGS